MAQVIGNQVRWYCPVTGKRRSRTLATAAAAKVFAARCDKDSLMLKEDYIDADGLAKSQRQMERIGELVEKYEELLTEKRKVSEGHRKGTMRVIRDFVKVAGVHTPRDITVHAVNDYLDGFVHENASARTYNAYRSALGGWFIWLVQFRHLDRNPVAPLRTMDQDRDKRRPSRALTAAEADALVQATILPRRQALYLFRLRAGLRCKEASRLLWSDIDMGRQVVRLRETITKNRKADVLPLTDDVCEKLVELQRDALKDGRAVRPTDSVFGPPPDRRTWKRDLDRAGVEQKTDAGQADPKCLRKTFDSFLMRAKVGLEMTGLLMRHTFPGGLKLTVDVYGDEEALLDMKREAVGRMVRWIESQRAESAAKSG